MSLAIDVDEVTDVLLADGWHAVDDRTFTIDSYEFLGSGVSGKTVEEAGSAGRDHTVTMLVGASDEHLASHGFRFKAGVAWISGPLTSVLAVKTSTT